MTITLLASLGVLLGGSSAVLADAPSSETTTIIYLVRHAEAVLPPYKEDPPNPPLNEEGLARAAQLAGMLGDAGITRIFSTDFKRTQETARPLARSLGLEVDAYDPRDLEGFAKRLRGKPGRSLVVGHSNTTPALVRLLGGDPGEPILEKVEFDRLYIVVLEDGRAVTSTQLRYGKDRR